MFVHGTKNQQRDHSKLKGSNRYTLPFLHRQNTKGGQQGRFAKIILQVERSGIITSIKSLNLKFFSLEKFCELRTSR